MLKLAYGHIVEAELFMLHESVLVQFTLQLLVSQCISRCVFLQVLELDCAGSSASNLSGLLDRFTNLQVLDLTGVGLETLKGFPSLPNLCEV